VFLEDLKSLPTIICTSEWERLLDQLVMSSAEVNQEEDGGKGNACFSCSSLLLNVLSGDAVPCCKLLSLYIEQIFLLY